jgi:hypothetical protein
MRKVVYPNREPRAIVSVAFPKRDWEVLAPAVENSGKKLSEFIRDAALAAAAGPTFSVEHTTSVTGYLRFRLT